MRVVDGRFETRERVRAMAQGTRFEAEELGFFTPDRRPVKTLQAGEVGYVITGLKDVSKLGVGDTLTSEERPAAEPLPGYKEVKPMVFAGLFPTDSDDYPELRDALERLKLNDGALFYEPETSQALGFGFRCGFLGLLHMEIVRERLEREFDLDLIVTAPNVAYRVRARLGGDWVEVHNPADMPNEIEEVEEPYIKASIIVPKEYVGAVMELCNDRRGTFDHMEYLSEERVHLVYELPLGEIVLDFYDQLKSRTRGYASFDYDMSGFKPGQLVRVDVLVAGEPVDALSLIIHREFAYDRGKLLVERLRKEIPRQFFDVAIQAAIGARIIARETVKAKRKDVLAKCYGGDISRKRKLLEKQKEGQEADEAGRRGRGPAGGVPGRAQPGRQQVTVARLRLAPVGETMFLHAPPSCSVGNFKFPPPRKLMGRSPPHERATTSTCTCRSARTVAATATSSPLSGKATSTAATSTRCLPSWSSSVAGSLTTSTPSSSAAARRPSPSPPRSHACWPACRQRRRPRSRRTRRP